MKSTTHGAVARGKGIAALALTLLAAGCASPGRTRSEDPLEGFNRAMYKFNDTVDRAALKPVAKGYKAVTPDWLRTAISNFFANITYPTTIVNEFLQGKPVTGIKDTGRFVLNTSLGLGGILDVATPVGLQANDEDFGQTLAVWGVGSGPYLMLPLFGPSSLRDAPSRVVDYFTQPLTYVDADTGAELGARAVDIINSRAGLLSLDGTLERTFDPYAFIRDAWLQQREFAIFDGDPPPETLEDLGLE